MTPGRVKHYDKYAYTSSRWLLNDNWNRISRYTDFNYEALCRKVVDLSPGSTRVVRSKKREGSYNRVFVMKTDTMQYFVAKLPLPCAGPTSLLTHSEVATMEYLRFHTSVPIPRVLDWSDHPDNVVGSEFVIMECDSGIPLHLKWPTMTADEKVRLVECFYESIEQVIKLRFPCYGSLYFEHFPLPIGFSRPMGDGFRIGPHCGNSYWGLSEPEPRYYGRRDPNRGPWSNISSYRHGLVDTGISLIPTTEAQAQATPKPWYHGSVNDHMEALDTAREVMKMIPLHKHFTRPIMVHPDLHLGNILVSKDDPSLITAIIDWQTASLEPAFLQMRRLPFLKYYRGDIHGRACRDKFIADIQIGHPILYQALNVDDDVSRLYEQCSRTWVDGAAILQTTLSRIAARWQEMQLPLDLERWPFPVFTESQLIHFNWNRWGLHEGGALRREVADLLETRYDGIVFPGNYEEKEHQNRRLFKAYLHYVLWKQSRGRVDAIPNEYQLRLVWPFDL